MTRLVCLFVLGIFAAPVFAGETVDVWVTTQDGAKSLSQESPIPLSGDATPKNPAITVDLDKAYQSILGLGASLEHATCENLTKLPPDKREEVIKKLVSPDQGIGMNLMRICIGSSDFIGEPYYTYNDLPDGETDPELAKFSIEKDREYVLPVIKTAQAMNPDLLFFASPWSPPAWMKTSGKLGGGKLKPEYYGAFAKYLLKFIQAYEAEGVPIHAVTVQNEPQMIHMDYPTTLWNGAEQRDFIRDHLGPLFRENNVKTLIWCWDHNWNKVDFPRAVLSDPEAAQYVDGTAFHHYEGKVEAQGAFHDEFPDKNIYFSEGSVFRSNGMRVLANILRNWSRSYNAWVIMLDEHRKPNRGPHSASATIIELKDSGEVEYRYDYYFYGQFMKFIPRGAVRVASDGAESRTFTHVAFKTPDGRAVMVVINSGRAAVPFSVRCGGNVFEAELPCNAVGTYRWKPSL
ncbi:MAG: hypothetical protein H3C30_14295 [Candidatus Hydrogenedentes bacterium]|nr:hypothetical protein [Candidatus Hydrogenedentota bacterium]